MKKIKTYSIEYHQQVFNLSSTKKDFFFIELGKNSVFNTEPRRSETYSISFLKKGELISQSGLITERLSSPAVITLAPTTVRSIIETENQPHMDVIFFTNDFLLEKWSNVFYLMEFDFFENEELHHIHLNDAQSEKMERIFDIIKETVKDNHYHQREIVRSCIFMLIHELNSFLQLRRNNDDSFVEKQNPLVANFKKLLYKDYLSEHSVSYYAGRLNVTAKHLSEFLKKQTGKTAGDWIDQAIVLEAKVLLQNKSLSVADISEHLNFSDQSVFGKFFKTHTSLTPLQYRKNAE